MWFALFALAASPFLKDASDREVFRGWFTFLAEAMFHRETADLPREVADCASLVRFAYREALRKHDGRWAADLGLEGVPPLGSVRQYNYPHTPTKAALFRVGPDQFAEFADAKTLMRYNATQVGRDLRGSLAGDLLFYHHAGGDSPYHLMVRVGSDRVVYHTGPIDGRPGEMRRPTLGELLRHPEPRWRPIAGNPSFVGVFRWNIVAR
jgi:uncharacterized protein YfaT (DUF1175 family)